MGGPAISDHALLRFLDRGGQLDVEALRANLSASLTRAHRAARALSEADYLIRADGLVFIVRGETVSTVIDDRGPPEWARALRTGAGDR